MFIKNNQNICSKLEVSAESYKCYFNGTRCDKSNICESIKK